MAQPMTVEQALAAALEHHQAGNFALAVEVLERVAAAHPGNADAHFALGNVHGKQGRPDAAAASYRRATECAPASAQAHFSLGTTLLAQGNSGEAVASLGRAADLMPDSPKVLSNLGAALQQNGRFEEAAATLRQSLHVEPDNERALSNLGIVMHKLGRGDEALVLCRRAVALAPGNALAHHNLGYVLERQGLYEEALAADLRAIGLNPGSADTWNNAGQVLGMLGRFEEAREYYLRSLSLKPCPDAYSGLGGIHDELDEPDAAMECFRKALDLEPDHPGTRLNQGLVLLRMGRFGEGFAGYGYRRLRDGAREDGLARDFARPEWTGEDLAGRTLLLYCEQGLGDVIQFIRYAPRIAGGRVIVEVPGKLIRLLRTLPDCPSLVPAGAPLPPFDVWCSIMSLPSLAWTGLDDVPGGGGYLAAEDGLVAKWAERLGQGFKVGLAWQGSPGKIDIGRSFPLAECAPLASADGVRFVSLQKGEGAAQLAALPEGFCVESLGDGFDSGADAFVDTAAVMMSLDLIVTSDTSVAHLAGALGRPVWLALRKVPEWRWGLGRADTPWYRSMRLFRQPVRGDWAAVFEEMARKLADVSGDVRTLVAAGERHARRGEFEAALAAFQGAAAGSDSHRNHHNVGAMLQNLGRFAEAETSFRSALARNPASAETLSNFGVVLQRLGRSDEALACCRQAVAWKPGYGTCLNLGLVLQGRSEHEDALEAYRSAIAHCPAAAEAQANAANCLANLGRFEEAVAFYEEAERLGRLTLDACMDFGLALANVGRPEDAVRRFRNALEMDAELVDAHLNLAMVLLRMGRFSEGFREWEWRKRGESARADGSVRDFDSQHWAGDALGGRTLLVYTEQGLGDIIQFIRYTRMIQGGEVIVEVPRCLFRLVSSMPGGPTFVPAGSALPPFDRQCALISLAGLLWTTPRDIPSPEGYLKAEEPLVARWAEYLKEIPGFRIGIAWQGSFGRVDVGRSFPVACYAPLAAIPGVTLISLQKGEALRQLEDLPDGMRVECPSDFDAGPDAFLDTAAVMMNLDLVITPDTAIAHLAGALGRPVWVGLKWVPDWRYGMDRPDCPWYRTMRLFRQGRAGDWDGVFEDMRRELVKLAGRHSLFTEGGRKR